MLEMPNSQPMLDIVQHYHQGGRFNFGVVSVNYTILNKGDYSEPSTIPNVISKKGLEIISKMDIPEGIVRVHHDTCSPFTRIGERGSIEKMLKLMSFGDTLNQAGIFGGNAVKMNLDLGRMLNYLIITKKLGLFDDELIKNIASVMGGHEKSYLMYSPEVKEGPNMGLALIRKTDPINVFYRPFVLDTSQ